MSVIKPSEVTVRRVLVRSGRRGEDGLVNNQEDSEAIE